MPIISCIICGTKHDTSFDCPTCRRKREAREIRREAEERQKRKEREDKRKEIERIKEMKKNNQTREVEANYDQDEFNDKLEEVTKQITEISNQVKELERSMDNDASRDSSYQTTDNADRKKSKIVTLLLCMFFGMFGVHRFYVGKSASGFVQLITFGGCGVWTIIDFIGIIVGFFKDKNGNDLE